MTDDEETEAAAFVVFAGHVRIAAGPRPEAAVAAKRASARDGGAGVLVFDAVSGDVTDLDLRGSEAEVAARYAPAAAVARRGRPKLGVTAREVTLLPRHWDWLARQPGGASVALRKLVDAARKADTATGVDAGAERRRVEAAYRFMSAMAGDLAGFEEASRALFAHDAPRLQACMSGWPADIAAQVSAYLEGAARVV
jgi:hypothetical protein